MDPKTRRYVELTVSNKNCGKLTPEIIAYNDAVLAIDPRAIAHYLYTLDLTDFNHRVIPYTSAAQVSKERGLNTLQRYFLPILEKSELTLPQPETPGSKVIVQSTFHLWRDAPSEWVKKEDFFKMYMQYLRENNEYSKNITNTSLWHSIYALFTSFAKATYHSRSSITREYQFRFPPVKLMRDEWRTKMRFWEFEDERP